MTLLHILLDGLMWVTLITYIIGGACVVAWKVVYYGFKCRTAPIGKAGLLAVALIWIECTAIINLL